MTPDTSGYFHAAYIAVAVIYGGYALSLWSRLRKARERRVASGERSVDRA